MQAQGAQEALEAPGVLDMIEQNRDCTSIRRLDIDFGDVGLRCGPAGAHRQLAPHGRRAAPEAREQAAGFAPCGGSGCGKGWNC